MMRLTELWVGEEELNEIRQVFMSGFLTQGAKTAEFESLVKNYTRSRHAHAMSSATTGLHMALVAIGVGIGDEVIIPDFSFPATANVVEQLGATPVFVDISLDTYNIDVRGIKGKITDKTKAIMPVHAFGLCADMHAINQIASKFSIDIIEDAACALGASLMGTSAGKFGRLGVFSFHPRKVITTGEGGMIVTDDDAVSERVSVLRSHGSVRLENYLEFMEVGYNYRLSDVNSAIGVIQMEKLGRILSGRKRAASTYSKLLVEMPEVTPPSEPPGYVHSYQSYVIALAAHINRDKVIQTMRQFGIETTLGTYAMHLQPVFQRRYEHSDDDFPNATFAHRQCLTLPLGHSMTLNDVETVCGRLKDAIQSSHCR